MMKPLTMVAAYLASSLILPVAAQAAPVAPRAPAQIADPAKQALAARVAASLWPDGTYGRMIDSMIGGEGGLAEMVLDMRPAEMMAMMAEGLAEGGKDKAAPKDKDEAPEPSPTLREMMVAGDPHFEERMRITMKVVGEEVRRIAEPIEPKFRDGLAKSIARRFTIEQLGPIAAFFETPAGRAYAEQSMTLFIDKDVMMAMIQSVPTMIKEMPAAMEKVKKATAHLPPPPKKTEPSEDPDDEDDGESGDDAPLPES